MKDLFRSRLKQGELLIGTLVTLPSPQIAEILVNAGFDWLFVDLEHSAMGIAEAQLIVQTAGERCDCLLRLPKNDEIWIKKALDTGAAGVIVPLVNSVEEARQAVRLCKYPPQGTRSVGLARAQSYGAHLQEYLGKANDEIAVVIQIEHIEAVNNIEMILKVEGIDAVFIGPYDLSASLGRIGQVEHPEVQEAIEHVRQMCLEGGVRLGIFSGTAQRAMDYIHEGYRLIAAGGDNLMLVEAARETLKQLHE